MTVTKISDASNLAMHAEAVESLERVIEEIKSGKFGKKSSPVSSGSPPWFCASSNRESRTTP